MRHFVFASVLLLVLPAVVRAEDRSEATLRRAAAIRATPDEWKFKRIPWITDVPAGVALAREEKRPIFLYTILGDPLEDC